MIMKSRAFNAMERILHLNVCRRQVRNLNSHIRLAKPGRRPAWVQLIQDTTLQGPVGVHKSC
jgi:hypothetical protein